MNITTPQERLEQMAHSREFASEMLEEGETKRSLVADAQLLRSSANYREKVRELLHARFNKAEVVDGRHELATELKEIMQCVERL